MSESRQLSTIPPRPLTPAEADIASSALSVQQILGQVALIQQVMGTAMKDGEHFGKIPGCGEKPTLLKPGAEKLCMMFRLAPQYEVDERTQENGHREYRVTTTLVSILNQANIGQGVGCCSTMEAKYRYRGTSAEITDHPVPRGYWDAKKDNPSKALEMLGGKGFTAKKTDAGWMIAKSTGERTENPDLADQYNTVLKMAKKRALVDAVLTATAASDIFTQDLEEITGHLEHERAIGERDDRREEQSRNANASQTVRTIEAQIVPDRVNAPEGDGNTDFRAFRIHFGKNRGLALGELTPQQVHWYEADWAPKKEVNGPTSVEDLALLNALKSYRAWRGMPVKTAAKPTVAPAPTLEDESQERPSLDEEMGAALLAAKVAPENMEDYLRENKGKGGLPELGDDKELSALPDGAKLRLCEKIAAIAPKVIAIRRKREEQELLETTPLN